MPEVSGFTMDLYCDNAENPYDRYSDDGHVQGYYADASLRRCCVKAAKKDGWKFHKDGTVTCPKCNQKG